jgi:uncharacterized SAM-binding protein YcdF (DUF218 family)/lysophospholipase L1-like esterase
VRETRPRFWRGVLTGIVLVFATAVVINKTPIADWMVAPLLVPDAAGPADTIVVLGAGVIGDCVPNQHGVRRVLLGIRQWRAQPSAVLLFSGGTGGTCPVAEAMARLARELGVPDDRVHVETASVNTRENAVMSTALLRSWGASDVRLVTDRLHMRRAVAVFARVGQPVQPVSVPIFEGHEDNVSMLAAGLREFAALAYYRMRGWLGPADPSATPTTRIAMPAPAAELRNGPIVLLGASYAASWPLGEIGGVPVINKGIAGQQSFELLARFDADVVAAAPRAVILWGFINDIFRSSADMDAAIARIKESYIEMIARARAQGIVPVLATEVTARPPSQSMTDMVAGWVGAILGKPAYQDHINRQVMAVNQWLIETATREGLLLLDLQQVIAEPGGRRHPAFAQADGSHITPAGYDMLSSYARPVLQEYLGVR